VRKMKNVSKKKIQSSLPGSLYGANGRSR